MSLYRITNIEACSQKTLQREQVNVPHAHDIYMKLASVRIYNAIHCASIVIISQISTYFVQYTVYS